MVAVLSNGSMNKWWGGVSKMFKGKVVPMDASRRKNIRCKKVDAIVLMTKFIPHNGLERFRKVAGDVPVHYCNGSKSALVTILSGLLESA